MQLFHRRLVLVLSLLLCFTPFASTHAAIVGNAQFMQQTQQADARNTLLQTMQREDVQAKLLSAGVNSTDVENRINQMTQQEVAQLNQQIEQLPAGGDGLGILLTIFIVFVITDVVGATDIFPFIRPIR